MLPIRTTTFTIFLVCLLQTALLLAQEDFETASRKLLDALQAEQTDTKLTLLYEAVRAAPSYAEARLELGKTLVAAARFEEASRELAKYSLLRPTDSNGYYYRATASMKLGEVDKALEHLNLSIAHDPGNWQAHNRMGELLLRNANFVQAKHHFQRSLQLQPQNAAALYGLGLCYSHFGEIPEAVDALERAIKIEPSLTKAKQRLTKIKEHKRPAPRVVIDSTELVLTKFTQIREALRQKDFEAADDLIHSPILRHREEAMQISMLRNAMQSLIDTKWDSASFYFNQVLAHEPDDTLAQCGKHYAAGRQAAALGDRLTAIAQLEHVMNLDKQFLDTSALLADLRRQLSREPAFPLSLWGFLSAALAVIVLLMIISVKKQNRVGQNLVAIRRIFLDKTAPLFGYLFPGKHAPRSYIGSNAHATVTLHTLDDNINLGPEKRYDILEEIGAGGMGLVSKAWDRVLERVVCLKTIRSDCYVDSPTRAELERRFLIEARAAAKLNHPNIVTVFDIQKIGTEIYIAMEYLNGPNLAELIKYNEPLPLKRTLHVMQQTIVALEFAHNHGIIHRDIKPSNIILLEADRVKVLDFGLARFPISHLTQPGRTFGTPFYMAPEQFQGGEITKRTDIFALGILFYEMLTGRVPFDGETASEVMSKVLTSEPAAILSLCQHVPASVSDVVNRMLAKSPVERYQTCSEILQDIERNK